MPLSTGDKLGPYEILAAIGAGGMGEVYRARDSRVGRDVAVKVSAEQFSDRFEHEARAIAALSHPNICTLFDVGASPEGFSYLIMEYIEGETLAERIAHGPIPMEEALPIIRQIADALDAAHERGITHRDLKPANIKIKPDGTVKVLDFGLAKLTQPVSDGAANGSPASSPTMTLGMTHAGIIMGTAGYMAPEQARGKMVDKRADIWAFAVVLYEMLTGKRLFAGEDMADTLASVIQQQADYSAAPPEVRLLLQRCLEKDPRKRLRDIGDAVALIGAGTQLAPAPPRSRPSAIPAAAAAVFALTALLLGFVRFREPAPQARLVTSALLAPAGVAFELNSGPAPPAISPDGSKVVLRTRGADGKIRLWLRPLDSAAAQPLAGTEDAYGAFWSADGRYIAFAQNRLLSKIDTRGGQPQPLTSMNGYLRGGAWSREGVILFGTGGTEAIFRLSASGGTPANATTPDASDKRGDRAPFFLPDQKHFLYASFGQDTLASVRVASVDDPGKPGKTVAQASSAAIYAGGHLLYLRNNTLMAQPFDSGRLETTGDAVPVAEHVSATTGLGIFGAAGPDLLIYESRSGPVAGSSRLVWMDRTGKPLSQIGDPTIQFGDIELSPDGRTLLLNLVQGTVQGGGGVDLWLEDLTRGLRTRFTFDAADDQDAVWTPDGGTIIWRSNRSGPFDLFRKASNGAGNDGLLYADPAAKRPYSVSPDAKVLLYTSPGAKEPSGHNRAWALPLTADQPGTQPKPHLLIEPAAGGVADPQFSPDGRWIAYASTESGESEIYVVPYPGPGGKRQISPAGGMKPHWRQDGNEIFYVTQVGDLMAAEAAVRDGNLATGKVQKLFGGVITSRGYLYAASRDGQKFIIAQEGVGASPPLTLISNWPALLKR